VDDIDTYRLFLADQAGRANARVTISRKLSSLRSLFHYLSQIAEDENLNPLLRRNVMAKIPIKRVHRPKDSAAKLEGKLLQEEEIAEFIEFVRSGYAAEVADNPRALAAHEQNRARDACIVSLVLHSGLRVSEVVNLNVDDLDLKRETRYRPGKKEKALFLAIANGKTEGSRMTKRAIQEMVVKYAKRFGKPNLSIHKLRHSFATDYYMRNDLYKTQEQLGHASPETTQIYAHLTDRTMAEAIDRGFERDG